VQGLLIGQSLDRGDVAAVLRDGQGQAGDGSASVDQDRARAALPVIAAFLRAGQAEALTEQVKQRRARVDND
jgi:hypothetical protein